MRPSADIRCPGLAALKLPAGATDDLAKVPDIARDRFTRCGRIEALGHMACVSPRQALLDLPGRPTGGFRASPDTQQQIDAAVERIVMDAFERTTAWLQQRRDALERGGRERLAREPLDEAALKLPAVPHAASG